MVSRSLWVWTVWKNRQRWSSFRSLWAAVPKWSWLWRLLFGEVQGRRVVQRWGSKSDGDRQRRRTRNRFHTELPCIWKNGGAEDGKPSVFARGGGCRIPRISCHEAANVVIKIVEHSNYPWYLAIVPLKQGGANDILSIEVYEKASDTWTAMRRVYGAVFDFQNPPLGELKIRLSVNGSDGQKWVESDKAAIPKYWKAGITIKTDIQLT
nr:expansin-like B1 [Ipomoea batatas]